MTSKKKQRHQNRQGSDDDILNIPLVAVRGTNAPTRADIGGWLQFIDSEEENKAVVEEHVEVPLARSVPTAAVRYAAGGASDRVSGGFDLIAQLEAEQIASLSKDIPDFKLGDSIRVGYKVQEGSRTRVQNFEGVCIARTGGNGIAGSFTVRKISFGEGVERVFPLFSENIESITVVRRGRVRRAKLYYLRSRRGKSARIAEDSNYRHRKTPQKN